MGVNIESDQMKTPSSSLSFVVNIPTIKIKTLCNNQSYKAQLEKVRGISALLTLIRVS